MVYYKPIKNTINISRLAKVRINIIIQQHSLPNSIIINKNLLFTSKFWLLLYYFFAIKRCLFTAFYPQADVEIEWQNSTIKAYLRAFVNFEQNN